MDNIKGTNSETERYSAISPGLDTSGSIDHLGPKERKGANALFIETLLKSEKIFIAGSTGMSGFTCFHACEDALKLGTKHIPIIDVGEKDHG